MRSKQKNKTGVSRSIFLIGCLSILLLMGCNDKSKAPSQAPPPGVQVAEVTQEKVPITSEFSGTLTAVKTVDIIPRVSGYIDKRYFKEGEFIKKGDQLYLIDPRPFQATLDSYNAMLQRDEALLEFYKSEAERYTQLAAKGGASKEKKDASIAKLKEITATIAGDKANIENAELDLSFTRINAPFSGRIQTSRFKAGQLVTKYQDILTTLIQTDPIHVVFFIPRAQIFTMQMKGHQEGMVTMDKMSAVLILPDGSEYEHKGKLDYTSFQIDPATDSMMVRAIFSNPESGHGGNFNLIPGQYAPLRINMGVQSGTLLIPQPALIEDEQGCHVYVVTQDNKVENRVVEIGSSYKNQWVIKKGLKKGEKVIVEGTQKARPGMPVKPEPYSPKTGGDKSKK